MLKAFALDDIDCYYLTAALDDFFGNGKYKVLYLYKGLASGLYREFSLCVHSHFYDESLNFIRIFGNFDKLNVSVDRVIDVPEIKTASAATGYGANYNAETEEYSEDFLKTMERL